MTQYAIDEDKIIVNLKQSFSVNKMVLFVGADSPKEIVTKDIAILPWSCIITSSTNESFSELFAGQHRKIREYSSLFELPQNIFESNVLPVIKIYEDNPTESLDEDELESWQEEREDKCNKILTRIMQKLDFTTQLVVVGYHPGITDEVKRKTFILRIKDCSGAKIIFFGLHYSDDETDRLKSSLNKLNIEYYDEKLGDMLARQEIESDFSDPFIVNYGEELFYKNNKPVHVKQGVILRYKEIGTLLTEVVVNKIQPYGRIQQSRWFLNFLTQSALDGPQWYGYLKQSEFYLKRDYEEVLYRLVEDSLRGKSGINNDYCNPIILEGDPASSKSVVLGALAYRIFLNKEFPVIFVTNKGLNTRADIEVLDEFMQEIESVEGIDSKILIIWDASSYHNIDSQARSIAKQLDNRGRRFLLVCSSYRNLDYDLESIPNRYKYKKYDRNELIDCKREEMEFAQDSRNGSYYVHASGELTAKELLALKEKVKLYVPDLSEKIAEKWNELDNGENSRLFDYLYRLIVVLQPPLKMGLDREQRKFVQYAQDLFCNMVGENIQKIHNPMIEALISAGLTSEELLELDHSAENDISIEDINKMNTCIALFSRFKLDCSVRLAFYFLRLSLGQKAYTDLYSPENRRLLEIIISSMPWITYRMNADNIFCFYYRSSTEAEIFITNRNISPEAEIEMISIMIDFYAEDYKNNDSIDMSLKYSLQKLIRMVGPNSEYFSFLNRRDKTEYKELQKHLDQIIEKLQWMRTEICVEDNDASFAILEITFLREFYGTNWNKEKVLEFSNSVQSVSECKLWDVYPDIFTEESYCLRMRKLMSAIDLANVSIERIQNDSFSGREKKALVNTVNALVVELCQCNIRFEELQSEYLDFCKCKNITASIETENYKVMSYTVLYKMLIKAIHGDPLNGYVYNALFKLFIKEYERSDRSHRYELLSDIRPIIDDAEVYGIENRGAAGRDELTENISIIRNFSSEVKVSIHSLDSMSVDEGFIRLFNDMLERGNPSVITFVCQQELDSAGLASFKTHNIKTGENVNNKLTDFQIEKCRELCRFMKREQYATCIETDPSAIYLQLKITWMASNGYPIMDGTVECRPTYLTESDWIEINRLCQAYERCAGVTKRPIVILLEALSLIQIRKDYCEANKILESLMEDMFFSSPRMRVPYMLCDEKGKPWNFSGKVIQVDSLKHSGFIKVNTVPFKLGKKNGIRFYQKNIGYKSMPSKGDFIDKLEMGIGYMGFSMYTKSGRSRLESN